MGIVVEIGEMVTFPPFWYTFVGFVWDICPLFGNTAVIWGFAYLDYPESG